MPQKQSRSPPSAGKGWHPGAKRPAQEGGRVEVPGSAGLGEVGAAGTQEYLVVGGGGGWRAAGPGGVGLRVIQDQASAPREGHWGLAGWRSPALSFRHPHWVRMDTQHGLRKQPAASWGMGSGSEVKVTGRRWAGRESVGDGMDQTPPCGRRMGWLRGGWGVWGAAGSNCV